MAPIMAPNSASEPSPGADVAGASPVPAQMWQGRAYFLRIMRCHTARVVFLDHSPWRGQCCTCARRTLSLVRSCARVVRLCMRAQWGANVRADGTPSICRVSQSRVHAALAAMVNAILDISTAEDRHASILRLAERRSRPDHCTPLWRG